MAVKKKSAPSVSSGGLGRALAYLWGPRRTPAALVLLVAGLAAAFLVVWPWVRQHVVNSPEYTLGDIDEIYVTPPPQWLHRDIRAESFQVASLHPPLSLLSENLAGQIHDAFLLHPWVARVDLVSLRSRHPPAKVDVDLVYRRPVCMVEVGRDLWPVDGEGVLLPAEDFTPNEKQTMYAILAGIETRPLGTKGQKWGDGRVLDGAQIAAAFDPAWPPQLWQQLKLDRIQQLKSDPARPTAPTAEPSYELVTRHGTHIVWGLAPGTKILGEPAAAEKVARLRQYAAKHGDLDVQGGPQALDVRLLPPAKKP